RPLSARLQPSQPDQHNLILFVQLDVICSANSALNLSFVSGSTEIFKAFSSGPAKALDKHPGSGQTYAPRPAFLPVGSSTTVPSAIRTKRTSARLSPALRQAMQVRIGTLFNTLTPVTIKYP